MRIRQGLRAVLYFVIITAGMLAVLHVESPNQPATIAWKKIEIKQSNTWSRMYQAAATATGLRKSSIVDQLREVMKGDELAGTNPFANLSADDAFSAIFRTKITAFERRTLRSPTYHEEAGYDLVHYEILHDNDEISSILAYVEKESTREIVVLMVLTPKEEKNQYAVYRDGKLEEISLIMPEEGAALLAQRLDSGIPFLSVSH